jgi:Skp family chaperone for outer membrane proteins
MKFLTKILIFFVLLSACSSSKPHRGNTRSEVYAVNHRAELRKEQQERQARVKADKKAAAKEEKLRDKAMKAVTKQKKKEEKLRKRALKKGAKRHRDWQSAQTRERMKKNKKESQNKMSN